MVDAAIVPATAIDLKGEHDVLSAVLRSIRLSGSLQFGFVPTGSDWFTDTSPSPYRPPNVLPFHIVAEGSLWLKMNDRRIDLRQGDIVAFPDSASHFLGVGAGSQEFSPGDDLPPRPWHAIPVLRYGSGIQRVRLLCGYLQSEVVRFRPLMDALPPLIHMRSADDTGWLAATIRQIVAEVDNPSTGGLSMLERLTEVAFIELLRREIKVAKPGSTGWLAALSDPPLMRFLSAIHSRPAEQWSLPRLATLSGLSRSSLVERCEAVLGTSPMRYLRDWRLYLASVALRTTERSVAAIAADARYGTEAAFSRAFSRAFDSPPASWRQRAKDWRPGPPAG